MVNKHITLMHPKGKGNISLSLEALGLSDEKGNYVLRCHTKDDNRKAFYDSHTEALANLKREASKFIAEGYFLPLPSNLSDMVDYDKSQPREDVEKPSWNTMERMPIDKAFFDEHYIREVYDGHHVLIKLCPSKTQPFTMWDGRGTYTLSDTLLSKLSMMHAYIDIKDMTINATLTHKGDVVVNEVLLGEDGSNEPSYEAFDDMRIRAANTPLRFLRFATCFITPERWHKRSNTTAYASFSKDSAFANKALRYYFPTGTSYRVVVKSLYELHATSEQGGNDIVLCLSKTPFISQLFIGESFVSDGHRIFTQPMFGNERIFSP